MSGYLLDENVPLVIQSQLAQMEPDLTVYAIGDETAPDKGTPDPDILIWIERHGCLLITNNRATMPIHLQEHLAQGRHIHGIVQLPKRMDISQVLEDLRLIYLIAEPDEFKDQIVYLPLRS